MVELGRLCFANTSVVTYVAAPTLLPRIEVPDFCETDDRVWCGFCTGVCGAGVWPFLRRECDTELRFPFCGGVVELLLSSLVAVIFVRAVVEHKSGLVRLDLLGTGESVLELDSE